MEHFEGTTTVRLKGPHGSYLWADEDQYSVSQMCEDKNAQAFWRVEKSNAGSKAKTVRLKSCFDTYLTASENHFRGIAFLSFSGKRATQMRPENVESTNTFDWEPVIEQGRLKLKSCYGTFLRANAMAPPWNKVVSHGVPHHESHKDWLFWEVEKVRVPNVVPLELVIGPIDRMEKEQPPLQEKSKTPGQGTVKRADPTEIHSVREGSKYLGEATGARRFEEPERHLVQERVNNPGVVATTRATRRADEVGGHRVPGRTPNPDVVATRRADVPERHSHNVKSGSPAMGTARRVEELEEHPVPERSQNPAVGAGRRVDESEIQPVQERNSGASTAKRTTDFVRHPRYERYEKPGGAARRADESEIQPVQERLRKLDVGKARTVEESQGNGVRERNPSLATARRPDESDPYPVQERSRTPDVGKARGVEESKGNPVRESNSSFGTARRPDEADRHAVQGRSRIPGADERERHTPQWRSSNPAVGIDRRVNQSEPHPVQERSRNPSAGAAIRPDEPERHPVQDRYKNPVVSTAFKADNTTEYYRKPASRPHR